jgi:pilus assembly protein CpaF
MRPDRIVVGECRGGEALDMLQAMNTGHDGSLTTVHANTPNDALSRLETMVLMAGAELPSRAIREQIGSAINIIVQQSRLRDGTRKIVSVAEVLGYDGERVQLQDIFAFKQTGVDGDGHVTGQLTPTGVIPQCLEHLASEGEALDISIFTPQDLAVAGGDG